MGFCIEPPYYPIVYVRGFTPTAGARDEAFHDAYYGFAETSVERREAVPPHYSEVDVFEGQMIRLLKLRQYRYADAINTGLEHFGDNPSRSVWICRYYDCDFLSQRVRPMEDHAEDLRKQVCEEIPQRLRDLGVELGPGNEHYRVILIAHSMGGLICRTLIQNLLPKRRENPRRWVHRLVTMGTPHRGIDLGLLPDSVETVLGNATNLLDATTFQERRMRQYLRLQQKGGWGTSGEYVYDVHSLGAQGEDFSFPVKRCFCLIGSDFQSYDAGWGPFKVKVATGSYSDGLVKQENAYVVAGPKPPKGEKYPPQQQSYGANVHRAHSGKRGLVNSYESFENLQRFLFGNVKLDIALEGLLPQTPLQPKSQYFYDLECRFSVRGTLSYLHRREQDPCQNAIRFNRPTQPLDLPLHTAFLNTDLRVSDDTFSRFLLDLRVVEYELRDGLFHDRRYPGRQIYAETLEVGIAGERSGAPLGHQVAYRWFSEGAEDTALTPERSGEQLVFRFPLRQAGALAGRVVVRAGAWPDRSETLDDEAPTGAG